MALLQGAESGSRAAEAAKSDGRPAVREASGFEAVLGPLIQTMPLTLEPGGHGLEAVGPFYYEQETEEGRLWAIPPIVSTFTSHDRERGEHFVLPPVFSYRKYGDDWRWQLGQWINRSHVEGIDDNDAKRFNLFPFFFYQDAPDPKRDYWALFPLYGNLKGRMFRDEAEFVAFPLWLESRKGTMTTRNVAFPFVHFRDGPGLDGWQFWPLAGHEHQDPSTRTNVLDEVEVVGGHDKTFALWPMWFRNRTGLGTENTNRVDAVLPFYYGERSPQRDHTSVMWPFVSWTDDRGEKFRQWNAPWPLVGFAHGEGKTLKRVLPFFSVGHTKTLQAETYMWPLYRRRRLTTEAFERDRWQVGVFLYSDQTDRTVGTDKFSRRVEMWPFFHWTRDPEGRERLQALTVIEPFGRGTGMRRNWSPLWSIWRSESHPATRASSQSLLWNLYRREATPERTKGSLLFGLVQYQKTSAGTRWRWFHVGPRLDATQPEPPAVSENDVSTHR
ncbi:MAG: hypothetical protein JNL97_12275 [Verrucomicrobiales bacterium]|nr:hypothetical protein [Verrucomicrobiales bacterium]